MSLQPTDHKYELHINSYDEFEKLRAARYSTFPAKQIDENGIERTVQISLLSMFGIDETKFEELEKKFKQNALECIGAKIAQLEKHT